MSGRGRGAFKKDAFSADQIQSKPPPLWPERPLPKEKKPTTSYELSCSRSAKTIQNCNRCSPQRILLENHGMNENSRAFNRNPNNSTEYQRQIIEKYKTYFDSIDRSFINLQPESNLSKPGTDSTAYPPSKKIKHEVEIEPFLFEEETQSSDEGEMGEKKLVGVDSVVVKNEAIDDTLEEEEEEEEEIDDDLGVEEEEFEEHEEFFQDQEDGEQSEESDGDDEPAF